MNTYFNQIVEEAIQALYCSYDIARGQEAFKKLQKASNEGDVDAMYLLARCYGGCDFCWKDFGFPEDEDKMGKYMRMSILGGSAMGVVGSMRAGMLSAELEREMPFANIKFPEDEDKMGKYMRMSILGGSAMGVVGSMRAGMLSAELEREMPFANIKEAWDIVYQKARSGSGFCQNMIGNSYYWLDIVRIEGRTEEQFSNFRQWIDYLRVYQKARSGSGFCQNMIGNSYYWLDIVRIEGRTEEQFSNFRQWIDYLRSMMLESIPWYEEALHNKIGMAGRNLVNLYRDGEEALQIRPQPQEAVKILKMGAELGLGEWMYHYGDHVSQIEGCEEEGVYWYKRAAEAGVKNAWYDMAYAYYWGEGVPKDLRKALEYAQKGLESSLDADCRGIMGAIYFEGGQGLPKDYVRAVQMLEQARAKGSSLYNDCLAVCYAMGYGVPKIFIRQNNCLRK